MFIYPGTGEEEAESPFFSSSEYQIYDKMGDLIMVRGWFMVKSLDFILSAL